MQINVSAMHFESIGRTHQRLVCLNQPPDVVAVYFKPSLWQISPAALTQEVYGFLEMWCCRDLFSGMLEIGDDHNASPMSGFAGTTSLSDPPLTRAARRHRTIDALGSGPFSSPSNELSEDPGLAHPNVFFHGHPSSLRVSTSDLVYDIQVCSSNKRLRAFWLIV